MRITVEPDATEEDIAAVENGLRDYNMPVIGDPREAKVRVFLRDDTGMIVGGLLGHIRWQWLYIAKLWVDESRRGQGDGTRLLDAAENFARERGCVGSYLDTFEYQARPFYEKRGYTHFGTLDGFPPGYCQFFLSKRLN